MPFGTCDWNDGVPVLVWPPNGRPKPELRQRNRKSFVLRKSLCYRESAGETVYVVPGADAPACEQWDEREIAGDAVVIPPNPEPRGKTDLASVPWPLWWLIASYGNHTRAVLLHDALYVEGSPLVPRKAADRLLLSALREPGEKTGTYRHWLMWAAVSAFGTMGRIRGVVFSAHVVAVWALALAAASWEWAPALWERLWPISRETAVVVLTATIVLGAMGFLWRLGVDKRAGWALPTLLLASPVIAGLYALRTWPPWSGLSFHWDWRFVAGVSPFALFAACGALMLVGFIWSVAVDAKLRGWLWPTALIGLPVALIPAVLVLAAVAVVLVIDFGAALAARLRGERAATDLDEEEQEEAPHVIGGVVIPSPTPWSMPRK